MDVIKTFNKNIYKLFRMNAIQHPTISSNAFSIFLSNFYKTNTITVLYGLVYDLMLSSNKREFIYEDLIFIDTKPITYQDK